MDNIDFADLFFKFDGRINRAKFWIGVVAIYLVWLVVGVVAGFDSPLFILVILVVIWPSLALSIKRWHDRGKSGWWIFIALVPLIGGIWALVETGFLPGTNGPNEYGPDPLAAGGTEPEAV